MKTFKKVLCVILSLMMIFALCPQILLSAFAVLTAPYLYYNTEIGDYETRICKDFSHISNNIPFDDEIKAYVLEEGWYYLNEDTKIGTSDSKNTKSKNIEIIGDVSLIVPDNKSLIVDGSIYLGSSTSSLTIFSQSNGEKMGTVKACGNSENYAGISVYDGSTNEKSGKIIIHGGNIIATGNSYSAGIGGNGGYTVGTAMHSACHGGTVIIYGGKVKATGGSNGGPGIGSGGGNFSDKYTSKVEIYGGDVTAVGSKGAAGIGGGAQAGNSISSGGDGGDVTVYGGKVTAYSEGDGAGIGGGTQNGDGGNFVMNGGEVIAYSKGNGAGIGSPSSDNDTLDNDSGYVTINGGTLTAYSMKGGAGIGGGAENDGCEKVIINGGNVTAYSMGDGAGIGGGSSGTIVDADGGDVIINDGTVTAYSLGEGAGIGGGDNSDGGNVTINNGNVTAYSSKNGAGIGGGVDGDGGKFIMNGGIVVAESKGHGAGIGSGSSAEAFVDNFGGSAEINGGKLEAFSHGDGAGIGGGDQNYGCKVTITGGSVTAYSLMNGAGIGGGACGLIFGANGGSVNISGGDVTAYSEMDGAGIGGGDDGDGRDVTVTGGSVTAYSLGEGAGIGGGNDGDGGSVTLSNGHIRAVGNKGGAGIGGGNGGDSGTFSISSGSLSCLSKNSVGVGEGKGGDCDDDMVYSGPSNYYVFDTETGLANKCNFTKDWKGLLRSSDFDVTLVEKGTFSVPYRVYDENGKFTDKEISDYKYLDSKTTTWSDGWYVLDGEGTYSAPINVNGNANLILVNDSQFTVNGGIVIDDNCTLTVYEQRTKLGSEPGTLTVNGKSGKAGISGNLIVHGGNIIANGADNAAGIGGSGSGNKSGSKLTLYNGSITAKGGNNAAGIGGAEEGKGGNLTIYKGTVTAVAGFYTARAIGAGSQSYDNGTITVPDYVSLFDSETKEEIIKPEGKTWNDVLDQTSVSFYAMLSSESDITYWDYDYTENKLFRNSKARRDCTELDSTMTVWDKEWYIAKGNVSMSNVTVKGDVKLILEDECRLEIGKGIRVDKGNSITIYARSTDNTNDTVGNLVISGGRSSSCAGIGGYRNSDCGTITINGGDLTVKGGYTCAGIGGGENAHGGTVIINGGEIDAFGGTRAAGIGTGANGTGGSVTINGGTVNVKSDEAYGAGIGSGDSGSIDIITINDGYITANGGDAGAGIGSGYGGFAESIIINGGTIDAISTMFAAGIGAGDSGSVNSIIINGGDVTATSGDSGVGIGANRYSNHCGRIAINGGIVKATGGERSIGAGNDGFDGYSKDVALGTGMLVYELSADGKPVRQLNSTNPVDMFAGINSVLIQKEKIDLVLPPVNKPQDASHSDISPTENNDGNKNYEKDSMSEVTNPQTGDTSNIALWTVLFIISSIGIVTCTKFLKKRKTVK